MTAQGIPGDERALLAELDRVLARPIVRAAVDDVARRVESELTVRGPGASVMSYAALPLTLYGPLPCGIRSSWVFALRAGCVTGAERHPGSRQRMVSWRGSGDLQTRPGDVWLSHRLTSDPSDGIERRWISIPEMTWHQAVVPADTWVVVSFHTVPAGELIEERPDDTAPEGSRRRLYLTA